MVLTCTAKPKWEETSLLVVLTCTAKLMRRNLSSCGPYMCSIANGEKPLFLWSLHVQQSWWGETSLLVVLTCTAKPMGSPTFVQYYIYFNSNCGENLNKRPIWTAILGRSLSRSWTDFERPWTAVRDRHEKMSDLNDLILNVNFKWTGVRDLGLWRPTLKTAHANLSNSGVNQTN